MGIVDKIREFYHNDETHLIDLTRHFFKRLFDSELISKDAEVHLGVLHILSLLAVPGIFYTFYQGNTYDFLYWNFSQRIYDAVCTIDQCRYVMFSMITIGVVAVVEWDRLFPDARDYAILMPLPLKLKTIFSAKIAALSLFLGLFMLAVAAFPTLVYPMIEVSNTPQPGTFGRLLWLVIVHGIVVLSGCLFMFLFFVALQGVLIAVLNYVQFKRVSLFVQGIATIFLVCQLFLIPMIPQLLPAWEQARNPILYALPPMWYLGLYRILLGVHNALFLSLARVAVVALFVSAAVAIVAYVVCYHRHAQMAFESAEEKKPAHLGLDALTTRLLDRLWLKDSRERATFYFVLKTLDRNSKHRLYFVGFVAVGVAFALLGIMELMAQSAQPDVWATASRPDVVLLSIPLIISFFTLVGMRAAFGFPAELPANWIFQITEQNNGAKCLSGVRKSMIALAVAPLFAVVLVVYSVLWGFADSLLTSLFGALLSLILVELLLYSYHKIPFTCSHLPGKVNLPLTGGLYWLVFAVYAYSMASLELWMFHAPVAWIIVLGAEAVILNRLMAHRNRALASGPGVEYEDRPEPAVMTLDLNA